ncbi:MAG: hypothetical protein E6G08_08125 [Actinobacteria bacterium]|nr:MAG: hypothetical protein E6G08_08125 [Actinomycetota bacterium]
MQCAEARRHSNRPATGAGPAQGHCAHRFDDSGARAAAGSVVALWRYPVKSMMGEELNAAEVTERGLVGDRQFAVVDASTLA